MNSDLSLLQLRTFLRIVDRTSLSAAAHDLGTTQPTISRRLKEIEAAYQTRLIVRTTRAFHVTDAGRLVYELAKQTTMADEFLRERLVRQQAMIEGRIRIGGPSGFGSFVLAPFCARFLGQHPGLEIDLCLSDSPADLVSEGIDVSIRIGRLHDSSLYARTLATLEEVIVSHPNHVRVPITRPTQLNSLPWIAFTGLMEPGVIPLKRGTRKQSVQVKPRLMISQITGYREALLAGGGAGLIHRYAVDADIQSGRLTQLLPEWQLPKWDVHAVFPLRTQTYRVRHWCDDLVKEFASAPGLTVR
jgi:DNA-binding transcriptional LysR family regulator